MGDDVTTFSAENPLGNEGVQKLSQDWGRDEDLTVLNLSSNDIGVPGASSLASALRASFTITSVDCSRNRELGDEGVSLLTPALLTGGTGSSVIRQLSLVRCAIGDTGATTLARALRGNSVLEQLKLSGNRIGDAGAVALINSLVGLSGGFLAELWLSSNRIGTAGATGIATALAKSPVLRELHLSGNAALGDAGVAALVKGAVAGERLKGLYLGGCSVGDSGVKEIANVLKNAMHLEILCLGHNVLGDDGTSALAHALADNRALRRILLPFINLRAAGGKALAGMLLSNQALFHLDVSGNRLGMTGIEAVASAIAKNRTLLELDLSACMGTDDSFRAVASAVESNDTLGSLLYAGNHLSADVLTEIEYSMGRTKRPVRQLMGEVQNAVNLRERSMKWKEMAQSIQPSGNGTRGGLPSLRLAPGQEASVTVAFGRSDNIIGSIYITNDTCLEEARALIDLRLRPPDRDDFLFVSSLGCVIPSEEKRARRVMLDCEVPVRLRPASWVSIAPT